MGRRSVEKDLRLDGRIVQIRLSPAVDNTGEMIGCVIEWKDRTEDQRNAALIAAINANQVRIEYDLDGRIVDANDNFRKLIKGQFSDASLCSIATMFAGNLEGMKQERRLPQK
ncbi:hypothetical protein [Sulfitobacter aestuariivivens]|uniref:hypothetical protein n=1 Tax=Sulfitobacter aestuariivivens TaxID=2766981 RepID=UPI00361ED5A7